MYDSNVSLPVDLSETETGILFLSIIAYCVIQCFDTVC